MVRGYQKRVVFLKNTGSELFEEAYFVMSDKNEKKKPPVDMLREANRIIEASIDSHTGGRVGFFRGLFRLIKRCALPFILGAVAATVICILILT